MLAALARFSVRHRWLVLIMWLVLVTGAAAAARQYGGSFTNDMTLSNTDSQAAYDTMHARFPDMSGDGLQAVLHSDKGITSPQVQQAVAQALGTARQDPNVAAARSPYGAQQRMVSADGRTAIVTVQFTERAKDIPSGAVDRAEAAFDPVRALGVQVEFDGSAIQTMSGPSGTEALGLAAAVIVLLIAFGSVYAMLVPLITALMALGLGLTGIDLLASHVTIGTSGPVVAAMIGLGVGIDYALLIVTRHREGLARGQAPAESIPIAMSTAGRAVLIAGTTVIVAILSLYAIGVPFVSALALAASITVAATLLASTTLLPALLGIFGTKLDRLRVRRIRYDTSDDRPTGWQRWVRGVQRFRWISVPLALAILATLAVPLLSLRLGTADDGTMPTSTTERRAYDLIEKGFGPGWTGPLLVTVDYGAGTPAQQSQAQTMQLRQTLLATDDVHQVGPPRLDAQGRTALLTVIPDGSPDARSTQDLVNRLRDTVLPRAVPSATAHVGGATATNIDLADRVSGRMGWFMLLVVGLAFLLLMVEFRSLLVPLVAVLMNLAAVGAAYGPVVAVFQWGWWPASLINAVPGPVESFAPVMLFAVLFGISTDYAVFLLSRVHEEHRQGKDARSAAVTGIGATLRVILAAASVMFVVFTSFIFNDQRVVNLFGFGLAMAVATYALVAMLVLVPALLAILGRAAWWLPRWIGWLLPGGRARHAAQPAGAGAGARQPVEIPGGDYPEALLDLEDLERQVGGLRARVADMEERLGATGGSTTGADPHEALRTLRAYIDEHAADPPHQALRALHTFVDQHLADSRFRQRYATVRAERDDLVTRLAAIRDALDRSPLTQAVPAIQELTEISAGHDWSPERAGTAGPGGTEQPNGVRARPA